MKMENVKLWLGLSLCAGFIALGIYLLDHPSRIARIIGGANIEFFLMVLAVAITKLINNKKA